MHTEKDRTRTAHVDDHMLKLTKAGLTWRWSGNNYVLVKVLGEGNKARDEWVRSEHAVHVHRDVTKCH